jgi:SAM-dependent methyltransferase
MTKTYVQFGCGLTVPEQWINFDASPSLRIQKTPILNTLLKKKLNVLFPESARYGDIIKGLPVADNSCDGVFCSHTLEHLSLHDCRTALKNTWKILKPGGIFRLVVPDLEYSARQYVARLDKKDLDANARFMGEGTLLGLEHRPRGLRGLLTSFFGNSHHLWMWDYPSMADELAKAGFREIRRCEFNDSKDEMFVHVEQEFRFSNALGIECIK